MATATWVVALDELATALRLANKYNENSQFAVPLESLSDSVVQQLATTLLDLRIQHRVGLVPYGEELRNWANVQAPAVEYNYQEAINSSRTTSDGTVRVTHTGDIRVTV